MSASEFSEHRREIAVIGMSCRFPGAPNLAHFWSNLRDGVESLSNFSDEDLIASGIAKEVLSRPNYVRAGAVLEGIEEFDASFFGMSPREAEMTDPQQRIFLEVAWEGLEDAGYDPRRYRGSIGVFAGSTISTYLLFNLTPDVSIVGSGDHFPTLIGNDKDYLATHVSYKLNLRGPSMSIQTACSTSLVAIHMACQSLLDGECDMALAGGAAISVPQKTGYFYQEGAYFSPDGHCRSFAADAGGTVFGSGVGVVVLKRLEDALRDGDCIDAIVKGSAINNDGAAKVGFTAPSVEGQARAISEALSLAEAEPASIGYVETHGTATPLGDPIEIAALSLAYSGQELAARSCAIGSVKSNVGHLDCAAGVAGFIKTVLSLKHAQIPPSLHCSTPNPEIDFDRTPFYVNNSLRPWLPGKNARRRAGVSSFGIGGTNAHVVLEEWPAATVSPTGESQSTQTSQKSPKASVYPLALSARHPKALRDLALAHRKLLVDLQETSSSQRLRDICYSATVRRAHHDAHRLFIVGNSASQMVQQLDAFLAGDPAQGLFYTSPVSRKAGIGPPPGVGFVFSGQGPQWWGMGRELLECSPVFRQTIEELDRLFQGCQTNWRLIDELTASERESRLDGDQIEITQCALFAVQVGLARMWQAFGVEPVAVIGHSMGEVAAAAASGVLELEEAVRVIYERSRLLQETSGKGMMAAVESGETELAAELADYEGTISIAAVNGRRASVVSGEPEAVANLLQKLERQGVMTRELRTTGVAGHSKQVDSASNKLVSVLGGVRGRASKTTLISTVTGKRVENEAVDAAYWGRNLRECVRFAEGMREMARLGPTVLVELNAHPVLGLWIGEAVGNETVVIGAMRRDRPAWEMTIEGLGQAYVAGLDVNWREIWSDAAIPRYVRLPAYPWQRQRFWIEPRKRGMVSTTEETSTHPFLFRHIQSSVDSNTHFWEVDLESQLPRFLEDHRIQDITVLPASFYIEMAFAGARELLGSHALTLREVAFKRVLVLDFNQPRKLQLVISIAEGGEASFRFSSLHVKDVAKPQARWVLHVDGKILPTADAELTLPEGFVLETTKHRCREVVSADEHYGYLLERGLRYGPAFRCVGQVLRNCQESIGRLRLPQDVMSAASPYIVHPGLLDSAFQVLATTGTNAVGDVAGQDIYVPVAVRSVQINAPLSHEDSYWAYGILRAPDGSATDEVESDLYVIHEDGTPVLVARGIRAQRLTTQSYTGGLEAMSDWLHGIEWVETPSRQIRGNILDSPKTSGRWLIFADQKGFGNKVASLLRARGEIVVVVSQASEYRKVDGELFELDAAQPEHFQRLFTEAFGDSANEICGIVHLWSLDVARPDQLTLDTLNVAREQTCASVLHTIQTLVACEGPVMPRLWLVTRGSQSVAAGDDVVGLAQSMLWGLGKVIGIEHAELNCTRIDLDGASPPGEIEAVLDELIGEVTEDEIAFRHGSRFVSQLTSYRDLLDGTQAFSQTAELIRPDVTYLITGGLGGLGLCSARWLLDQGARHLVLVSRSKASAEALEMIDSMRQSGAQVSIVNADVARYEELAVALDEIEPSAPLAGVFHAAGTLDDGLLLTLDWERFEKVTRAKVEGAWNLHRLIDDKALDFFVLFSSAGSMLGSAGQGNHVAGNAFLDALAHYRRSVGLTALSINWSQWLEVGKVASVELGARLALQGIPGLRTELGLKILELLLRHELSQVGVLKFDLRQWSSFYPQAANSSLLKQFNTQRELSLQRGDRSGIRSKIDAANSTRHRLELLEQFLKSEVAWVLRLSPNEIPTDAVFSDLALDSLRALELRNRMEEGLNLTLPATLIWQFPTVETLVGHLAERIGIDAEPEDTVASSIEELATRHESLLAELEQLSEAEAEALLSSKLTTLQAV